MNQSNTVLVALDPSSDVGESALEFITGNRTPDAAHITLLVSLSGHTATAFRAYAESEGTSTAEAASVYLAQVTSRLAAGGFTASGLSVTGLDVAADLAAYAVEIGASAIAVPAGGTILPASEIDRVAKMARIPVIVVPSIVLAA